MVREMIDDRGVQVQSPISILLAGDIVLDVEDADHWLSGIAPAVLAADVAIGHLEVPHTRRGSELAGDVPAPGAEPAHLDALARAGFDAVSLAGNHIADRGPEGIEDTIARLDALGIAHAGAGATLELARRPAVLQVGGRKIALLSYNCVGPEAAWATRNRAGCAYLKLVTSDGSPVSPTAPLLAPHTEALQVLHSDISAARKLADLVIVALHKGIVHTPARLADYEQPIAHAALEAGADIVVGHHAHIVRGIEIVRGKPVFHGLGNGCVVTRALSPGQDHPARAAWVERRKRLFGFEPDPAYTLAPFHPEAVNAMLGRVLWDDAGGLEAGVVPVHVEPPGRPVLATGTVAGRVKDYLERITAAGGLPPLKLTPRSDMLVVQ